MKRTRVRFNLGAGPNHMKWKVEYPDGTMEYHSPEKVQLVMTGCTVKNHRKTSQRIFDGGEKVVCAWVLCESVRILKRNFIGKNENRIRFNPRVQPNWLLGGRVVDGEEFGEIFSVEYGLYVQQTGNNDVLHSKNKT